MFTYEEAAHAMQAGVKLEHELTGARDGSPKHLRVGVNSAMCDNSALAKLLIAKGIISDEEYRKAILDEMNAEVVRYEKRLSEMTGGIVKLYPGEARIIR